MSFKYNPFTGNLDEVGSGSSSPYFLDPVDTADDLPLSDPDGSIRVVKDEETIYVYDLVLFPCFVDFVLFSSFSSLLFSYSILIKLTLFTLYFLDYMFITISNAKIQISNLQIKTKGKRKLRKI